MENDNNFLLGVSKNGVVNKCNNINELFDNDIKIKLITSSNTDWINSLFGERLNWMNKDNLFNDFEKSLKYYETRDNMVCVKFMFVTNVTVSEQRLTWKNADFVCCIGINTILIYCNEYAINVIKNISVRSVSRDFALDLLYNILNDFVEISSSITKHEIEGINVGSIDEIDDLLLDNYKLKRHLQANIPVLSLLGLGNVQSVNAENDITTRDHLRMIKMNILSLKDILLPILEKIDANIKYLNNMKTIYIQNQALSIQENSLSVSSNTKKIAKYTLLVTIVAAGISFLGLIKQCTGH